jgi:hypothetical protein
MASSIQEHSTPIEVWLTQTNMAVTCLVVHEDESTEPLGIDAVTMRGAQREITGYLIAQGYEPAGRWQWETDSEDGPEEAVRRFK